MTSLHLIRLQGYQNQALKDYFDQEALCMPVEDIAKGVSSRDYAFFLGQKQFYKVVDTLERY